MKAGRVGAVVVLGSDTRVSFHARVEHFVDVALGDGRALDVLVGLDSLSQLFALTCRYVALFRVVLLLFDICRRRDGRRRRRQPAVVVDTTRRRCCCCGRRLDHASVHGRLVEIAQIALGAHQNNDHARNELV